MSIISYAQNFEDVMLWRALGHIEHGVYIDIGAQDPVIDSVSLAFHEHSWKGIHVEPIPCYAELLRQQRPGDIIIQAAVSNGPAILQFYEITDTGISTADANIAAQHRERGFEIHEITVPSVTLETVFKVCTKSDIHWLKIDVEGFEQQVLASWGKSKARPWIIVVESTLPLTQIETHENWEPALLAYGYEQVYFDGLNRYYVSNQHPELKRAFTVPPNVFDAFKVNGTASTTFHKLVLARYEEKLGQTHAQIKLLHEQHAQLLTSERKDFEENFSLLKNAHSEEVQKWIQTEKVLCIQNRESNQELKSVLTAQVQHEQDRLKHEQTSSEKFKIIRVQLQNLLQTLALREQEAATQLLNAQKQGTQEKAALIEKYSVLERDLLQTLALREQEVAAQLLSAQQRSNQEKLALVENYSVLQRNLEIKQVVQIEKLNNQLERAQLDRRVGLRREQELSKQISLGLLQLTNLQSTNIKREREVNARILAIQEKFDQATSELRRNYSEQERALKQQLLVTQQTIAHNEQLREKKENALAKEISDLHKELRDLDLAKQLQTQKYIFESSATQNQHGSQIEIYKALEVQLQVNLQDARLSNAQLRQSIAELRHSLSRTHASFIWRITAPLRKLTSLFLTKNKSISFSPTNNAISTFDENYQSSTEASSTIIIHQAPIEHIMPSFAEATQPLSTPVPASAPAPALTLGALLGRHDQQFVQCAYTTLLGRTPDPEGLSYYLSRLRAGHSKMQIIFQLSLSTEAKACSATLPGLKTSIERYRRGLNPLTGWIFRRAYQIESNHHKERKQRRIENQLFALNDENQRRFNQIESSLHRLHRLVIQQTQSVVTDLGAVPKNTLSSIPITPVSQVQPDDLGLLTQHAQEIYFQLKAAVESHIRRIA